MNDFEFHRPTSVADAAAMLASRPDARLLAGGQSLLPTMKLGLASPSDLVDLSRLGDLAGIRTERGALRIGAMTTHASVAFSDEVRRRIPALASLAAGIGDVSVRTRGTLGGSLANNDPAADYPAAVLALGATVHTNRRAIPADDFFQGLYTTALERDEIIQSVDFPVPRKAAYATLRQPASRFALVGVFVAAGDDGVRVGVTGAGPCAFRAGTIEKALAASWSSDACLHAHVDADGLNEDLHASARYRAHLIGVLAARAVGMAG